MCGGFTVSCAAPKLGLGRTGPPCDGAIADASLVSGVVEATSCQARLMGSSTGVVLAAVAKGIMGLAPAAIAVSKGRGTVSTTTVVWVAARPSGGGIYRATRPTITVTPTAAVSITPDVGAVIVVATTSPCTTVAPVSSSCGVDVTATRPSATSGSVSISVIATSFLVARPGSGLARSTSCVPAAPWAVVARGRCRRGPT